MNVEQDVNWSLPCGAHRDTTGAALRRAMPVQTEELPGDFVRLLESIDKRRCNRRMACHAN